MREPCPHFHNNGKHNTARVIYGYTDDGDQELNDRDGKDLYLAGCVPDSYGITLKNEPDWYYPMNYCNRCQKFFNYAKSDIALGESP